MRFLAVALVLLPLSARADASLPTAWSPGDPRARCLTELGRADARVRTLWAVTPALEYVVDGDRAAYRKLAIPAAAIGVDAGGLLSATTTIGDSSIAASFQPGVLNDARPWRDDGVRTAGLSIAYLMLYRTYAPGLASISITAQPYVLYPNALVRGISAAYRTALDRCARSFAPR